jgi:hypothetical protein
MGFSFLRIGEVKECKQEMRAPILQHVKKLPVRTSVLASRPAANHRQRFDEADFSRNQ